MPRIKVYPDRCRGCKRCEVGCIASHHGLTMKEAMKRKSEFTPRVRVVKLDDYKTTIRCHECNPAPCVNICPAHALEQGEDGIIKMHSNLCIACGACVIACPYGAANFDIEAIPHPEDEVYAPHEDEHKIAVRCDLCKDWRAENGKGNVTACMEACVAQAISFIDDDGTETFAPKPVPAAKAVKKAAPAK